MENNYNIDEILSAVEKIYKKEKKIQTKTFEPVKKNNSDIPVNTLKLIEEAEQKKNKL